MAWAIEISRTAERQIAKLSRPIQQVIVRFLRQRLTSVDDPRASGKPLRGEKKGLWRYRVGDYRLICDIQDERTTVLVLMVGRRKNVYR